MDMAGKSFGPLAGLARLVPAVDEAEYIRRLEERVLYGSKHEAATDVPNEDENDSALEIALLDDLEDEQHDEHGGNHDFGSDFDEEIAITRELKMRSGLGSFSVLPMDLWPLILRHCSPQSMSSLILFSFPISVSFRIVTKSIFSRRFFCALESLTRDFCANYYGLEQPVDLSEQISNLFRFAESNVPKSAIDNILTLPEASEMGSSMKEVSNYYAHTLNFNFPVVEAEEE